jgi:hypothetical protein
MSYINEESQRVYSAPVKYITKTWIVVKKKKKIHILLFQVYCVRQVVETPIIISNNLVYIYCTLEFLSFFVAVDLLILRGFQTW